MAGKDVSLEEIHDHISKIHKNNKFTYYSAVCACKNYTISVRFFFQKKDISNFLLFNFCHKNFSSLTNLNLKFPLR